METESEFSLIEVVSEIYEGRKNNEIAEGIISIL